MSQLLREAQRRNAWQEAEEESYAMEGEVRSDREYEEEMRRRREWVRAQVMADVEGLTPAMARRGTVAPQLARLERSVALEVQALQTVLAPKRPRPYRGPTRLIVASRQA